MLRSAKYAEKEEIKHIWMTQFANYEKAQIRHYFEHGYDENETVVMADEAKVLSTIHIRKQNLKLLGKKLETSYILGVATIPDYRRFDYMKRLMHHVLDEEAHNHLITLIDAFYPKLYEPFGFTSVYEKKQYQISRSLLAHVNPTHVRSAQNKEELYEIYRAYIRHFDAYIERDEAYFEDMIEKYAQMGGVVVYENVKGIQGYACYVQKGNFKEIREIVYLGSAAILKLARNIIQDDEYIMIHVSQDESLEKLFPLAIPKKVPHMMARINHMALFNRFYGTNYANTKEVFEAVKKPMFLHEEI